MRDFFPFHSRPALARALLLVLITAGSFAADAQETTAAPAEHVNTLGVKFVAVPGTTVMFAAWETRVSDYEAFVKDAGYAWSYKPHFNQGGDHPIVGANLQDAIAFCNWLTNKERASNAIDSNQSYRLPTNDEWDAAINLTRARKAEATLDEKVQDERSYPWGLQWPPPAKVANFAATEIPGYEDGHDYTAPVGSYPPSKEGLFDLAGNVWEWVWDREVRALPVGTLRGGSWAYFRAECLTSSYRYEVPAELRAPTIGFRCVFEDRRRTASLLADREAKKVEDAKQRQAQMSVSTVDPKELEAMRERLRKENSGTTAVDASKLTPAAQGKAFTNSLGMAFIPLGARPLLAGQHEVRLQDYQAFLTDTGTAWENKPTYINSITGAHAVAGISWEEAMAFCEWLTKKDREAKLIPLTASYRLPKDVEWSAMADMPAEPGADPAARHLGNPVHFPWGSGIWPPPLGSVNIDSEKTPAYRDPYSYPAPVGSFSANPAGFHDLGGNVAEWCEDAWPGAADERVFRGGSYLSFEKESLLSSARGHLLKSTARPNVGFRCILQF